MEEDKKLTLEFVHIDEFGNRYAMQTTAETFPDLGETDMDFFGDQFNNFIRQCGYIRKNDHIFMEDVTEDELWALEDFLNDLRSNAKTGGEDND